MPRSMYGAGFGNIGEQNRKGCFWFHQTFPVFLEPY